MTTTGVIRPDCAKGSWVASLPFGPQCLILPGFGGSVARKRLFQTRYGYFTDDGREYVITRPDTPKPWVNVICPERYGTVVSQAGAGYSWSTHATLNRITRWEQDLVRDEWGKHIYCRDRATRWAVRLSIRKRSVRARPAGRPPSASSRVKRSSDGTSIPRSPG